MIGVLYTPWGIPPNSIFWILTFFLILSIFLMLSIFWKLLENALQLKIKIHEHSSLFRP